MMSILRGLEGLRRDERGIALIIFTIMLVPILIVVGVAIDFGQVLVMKRQLVAAVDAAALTTAALPGLDTSQVREKASAHIQAHYPAGAFGMLKSFSAVRSGGAVTISATAELETTFLRIAGYDRLSVTVASRALTQQNRLEVVMVLDNTGSMSETIAGMRKIDALKSAAGTLVDALFGSADISPSVRIGLVPFASAVNVGSGYAGAAWMDGANPGPLNKEHVTGSFTSLFQLFAAMRSQSWGGCVRARIAPYDLTDAPPSAQNAQTLFTPYFAPDELPDWGYHNNYLDADNGLKYKPFSHYQGRRSGGFPGTGPNHNCPEAKIQPLTNVRSTITAALASMTPSGSTVIPEGLAWGWRVISPGVPFTEGAPFSDIETVKVIILLTDGINNVGGGTNGVYRSQFSAYGYADNGHIGRTDGSDAARMLDNKTTALCQNIKADQDGDPADKDILLYTIVLGDPGQSIRDIMRGCASDSSRYFNSPTAEELRSAFETIGYGLTKLRLAM